MRPWGLLSVSMVYVLGGTASAQVAQAYPPPPAPAPTDAPPPAAAAPPSPYPAPPAPVYAPPAGNQQPAYPPQPQPVYTPGYAPGPQPLPAPFPLPPPVLQPPPPPRSRYRSADEMAFLYGTGIAYGVGSGIWIDALAKEGDPGIAFIAPAMLGAAVPIGLYAWDQLDEFDRGVPSTVATGLLLGGVEGAAISGLQWQVTGNGGPHSWDFRSWTSITFVTATAGGVGGYAFGEWLQPDPRSLGLITSAAGWGALNGILFGSGVVRGDWKDGAAVWGFAGYNVGIVAAGVVSTLYVPSWQTIRYMWIGDVLGTLATTPVYFFYLGSSGDNWRHGFIANAVGGVAGLAIAAVLTANMTDGPGSPSFTPPFQLAVGPTPRGGAELQAYGSF